MRNKQIYLTLDTETWDRTKQYLFDVGGIIHDRQGNEIDRFRFIIKEDLEQAVQDDLMQGKLDKYIKLIVDGVPMVDTRQQAVDLVKEIINQYNVNVFTAFNAKFDYQQTLCKQLLDENAVVIDLWNMVHETICQTKKYQKWCQENDKKTLSGKWCSTSAETIYGYLTDNPSFEEEHTALEDAEIELEIFNACIKSHKKYTKNKYASYRNAPLF